MGLGRAAGASLALLLWAGSGGAALAGDPDWKQMNDAGFDLLKRSEYAQAEGYFSRAIALNPGHPAPHNNLGASLLKRNLPARALSCFRDASRLDPKSAKYLYNQGVALYRLGDSVEAKRKVEEATALDPDYVRARMGVRNGD